MKPLELGQIIDGETRDYFNGLVSEIDRLKAEVDRQTMRAETAEVKYYELIMAVERKYPDETRHETALKYIRDAEAIKDCVPKQAMRGRGEI